MKKSILTIALTLTILSTFAARTSKLKDYVVTKDGITYADKIRFGFNNTIIAQFESGEKIKFKKGDINAYRQNGTEYKRLYFVYKDSNTVERIFMQKILTRAGYTIYRDRDDFYVFHGDQLELKIDNENYKIVLSFFFPKFNLLYSN